MRPLPRLFAFTDASVRGADRIGAHAAELAALGPAVALVARDHEASGAELSDFAGLLLAHCRPAEAALIVSSRPDIAAALGAQGVNLRSSDLPVPDVRRIFPGWIGRSVHTVYEGGQAVDEGADYLVAGPIYETPSHPGRPVAGIVLLEELAQLGPPVIAIGGMTPERARDARKAGAWGVAAISALWRDRRPGAAAQRFLDALIGE